MYKIVMNVLCSNPASFLFGCVYITNIRQGVKSLCLVSWVLACPSSFSVDPEPSFKGGGVPYQQQSSTNQWDLLVVNGLAI